MTGDRKLFFVLAPAPRLRHAERTMPRHPTSGGSPSGQFSPRAAFVTTRWSVVLRAGETEGGDAGALEELCRACWFPVYAFIRRGGHAAEEAQDLTQGFFAHVLERRLIGQADPARGRFRSFLLGALKIFLAEEARRASALKRGGGIELLPIDVEEGEERYLAEPATDETPDLLYDRRWAETLLARAMATLRNDYERAAKAELFAALSPFLSGRNANPSQEALAAQLGMEPNTVTVSIYRMRRRYAEILRQEIAQTVAEPAEVDAEIRYLLSVVR